MSVPLQVLFQCFNADEDEDIQTEDIPNSTNSDDNSSDDEIDDAVLLEADVDMDIDCTHPDEDESSCIMDQADNQTNEDEDTDHHETDQDDENSLNIHKKVRKRAVVAAHSLVSVCINQVCKYNYYT